MRLLDVMVSADFSNLVSARDPTIEVKWWREEEWDERDWHKGSGSILTLDEFVTEHPEAVSDFLSSMGFSLNDLLKYSGL
jgi:hypothetical protein